MYNIIIFIFVTISLVLSGHSQDARNELKTLSNESATIAFVVKQNGIFKTDKLLKGAQDQSFMHSIKELNSEMHASKIGILFVFKELKTVSFRASGNTLKSFQLLPVQETNIDQNNVKVTQFLVLNEKRIALSDAIKLISIHSTIPRKAIKND